MSSVYRIENEGEIGPLGRRGIELTHEIMYRHYRRDEDFVYAQMAEGVTWIGPSRAQYTTGVDKLRELLQIEQLVTFTMEQETYQVAYEDEHTCLIFGCYTVTSDEETGLFIRTLQRVSFFYRLIGDRLHVVHMHLSHPYEVVDSDEVFPFRYGKDAFDYIQQTHQMAFTDSLTELGNRNAYETSCVRMAHDFDSVRSLCLILFDLNGMKRVNDTWGREFGDIVLNDVAAVLRRIFRRSDYIGRIGDNEFLVLLRDVEPERLSEKKAQEFYTALGTLFSARGDERYKPTCSVGIARYPMDGTLFETVFQSADAALHEAKRLGLNRVAFASGCEGRTR